MVFPPEEVDETARLVLMQADNVPDLIMGPLLFGVIMRKEHPGISYLHIADLWERYKGYDGRSRPTHNYETGDKL